MSGALRRLLGPLLTVALLLAAPLALAADPLSIPAITLSNTADGQQEYSVSLQILLIDGAELHSGVRHPHDQLHPYHHRVLDPAPGPGLWRCS